MLVSYVPVLVWLATYRPHTYQAGSGRFVTSKTAAAAADAAADDAVDNAVDDAVDDAVVADVVLPVWDPPAVLLCYWCCCFCCSTFASAANWICGGRRRPSSLGVYKLLIGAWH